MSSLELTHLLDRIEDSERELSRYRQRRTFLMWTLIGQSALTVGGLVGRAVTDNDGFALTTIVGFIGVLVAVWALHRVSNVHLPAIERELRTARRAHRDLMIVEATEADRSATEHKRMLERLKAQTDTNNSRLAYERAARETHYAALRSMRSAAFAAETRTR